MSSWEIGSFQDVLSSVELVDRKAYAAIPVSLVE
jgi:hypothetical protein